MHPFAILAVFAVVLAAPVADTSAPVADTPAPAAEAPTPVAARYDVYVRPSVDATWDEQGTWVFGGRADERPIELRLGSGNRGLDVVGQVKYRQKEGMLGLKLRRTDGRLYTSATKAGNADHVGESHWVIGTDDQSVKQLIATSKDGGRTLTGKITYADGEPMEFQAVVAPLRYHVQTRSRGEAQWQDAGTWVMGNAAAERPIMLHIIARGGNNLGGAVQYAGHVGFQPTLLDLIDGHRYQARLHGEDGASTDDAQWVIGNDDKPLLQLYAKSTDGGQTLTGNISYRNAGSREFKATLLDGLTSGAATQPAAGDGEQAATPARSAWDGGYVHDQTRIEISDNASKLTLTTHGEAVEAEITSISGDTFTGDFLTGDDKTPFTGRRTGDTLSLTVLNGDAIEYKAVPADGESNTGD